MHHHIIRKFQRNHFRFCAAGFHHFQAFENTNTVIQMDGMIALIQVCGTVGNPHRPGIGCFFVINRIGSASHADGGSKDFLFRQQEQFFPGAEQAAGQILFFQNNGWRLIQFCFCNPFLKMLFIGFRPAEHDA